tara:strand:+ start:1684 stop:4755 length:3072 start_codon:yes stop_codon:yes gene_type:complete
MSVNVNMSDKIKKVIKKKMIKYKGKNLYYTNIPTLAKKLKINKETAKQLVNDYKNGNTIKYIEKDGDIIKYDYTTKSLFLRDFGIKKIENKKLLNNLSIKGVDISNEISTEAPLNLIITATLKLYLSSETIIRKKTFETFINSSSINKEYILQHEEIQNYVGSFGVAVFEVDLISFDINSQFTEQKFKFEDMELYDTPNNLNIDSLFNEVLENKNWKDCVFDFMSSQYKKYSKKKMKELRTINDLHKWSIDNNIKMLCYDITGKIIVSNYPIKKNKMKNLVFIAYNNHLYPLKNTKLSKTKKPQKLIIEIIPKDTGLDKILSFINKGILPTGIFFQDNICKCFTIDNKIKYVDNHEYHICEKILTTLGLIDNITPLTNLKNIGEIIEPIYLKQNINSFIPKNNRFIKGGCNYTRDISSNFNIDYDDKDITTIDKNKAYSNALRDLNYLIKTDIKIHNIKIIDSYDKKFKIKPHYLYVAEPTQNSILMENNNLYTGEHLIYCNKVGLDFIIKEELETEKVDNYYKDMVNDLYDKLDQKHFKTIINIMIGKMERNNEKFLTQKVIKVINEDEADRTEGFIKRLNDKYYIVYENNIKLELYNRKPISLQIKEKSRRTIYEMCKNLELNESNVIQIKTDSISFINGENIKYDKYINEKLEGWKMEKYSPIKEYVPYNNMVSLDYGSNKNKNILVNCYAGAGKTHIILNTLIPKLQIKNENNYEILTPSHSTLKEYRNLKMSADLWCNVIQRYTLGDIIPEAEHIIIDEIGMIDKMGWDLIYKMFLLGKRIYAYGDFKQLKSVDGYVYDKQKFLDLIFGIQINMNTNYRNNFTQKYYDSLIHEKKQDRLVEEMKKYRHKDYKTAETIICYRNTTKDKYNKLMAEHLNIYSKRDIGAKVICISNKFKNSNIYNKFTFKVIDSDEDNIILGDGLESYKIPRDLYDDNFNYAYARTLYSVQGETLKSFYYPNEDLYFIDGRTTYTLISRLKQNLDNHQIERNNKNIDYDYFNNKRNNKDKDFIIDKRFSGF